MGPFRIEENVHYENYKELYHLYGAVDIVKDITVARLRWLDHVQTMDGS